MRWYHHWHHSGGCILRDPKEGSDENSPGLTGGVYDNGLGVLNSICTLWGGVGCDTVTLWDGTGGYTDDNGTLWDCTGRDICGIVGFGVATGILIVGFFGGSSEEFCYFEKFIFGYVVIFQWWCNGRCDLQDVNNLCCWMIEIILWCDIWKSNLGQKDIYGFKI